MSSVLLALALAAASQSKLGVVVVGDTGASTSPAGRVLAACPALVVFPISSANLATVPGQIRSYQAACPGGKVVVQVGDPGITVSAAVAVAMWPAWFVLVNSVSTSPGVTVDGVEGPWNALGNGDQLGQFWAEFARNVSQSGFRPVIGAFGPGLPSQIGTPGDGLCPILDQVRAIAPSFAVSFHAGAAATMAASDLQQIATDCALGTTPLFVTQALPASSTWTQADATWLIGFARQLPASAVGVAAFALGTSGVFDLSPIAAQLEAELTNPSGGGGGGGNGGGSSGGVVGPSYAPATGELSPPKQGCSTGGAELGLGMLAGPIALLIRRRPRRRTLRA